MRQTVSNMLGTLPAEFFTVKISTLGENLAQLMYSVMMTGYMFRNIQTRMDFMQNMTVLPGTEDGTMPAATLEKVSAYAPGVQKSGVTGQVLRWNEDTGAEAVDAVAYMSDLEAEVEMLKNKVAAMQRSAEGRNPLLDYLKSLEPQNMQELTETAGPDVLEAMNSFIHRLMGTSDGKELSTIGSDHTTQELSRLLYYLMVVGYSLRTMEVRIEMDRSLGVPLNANNYPPELPPAL